MRTRNSAAAVAAMMLTAAVLHPVAAQAWAEAQTNLRLAYLDPGSGSFILQALIAAVAGAALAVNAYWRKLKRLFGFGPPESSSERTETESTDA